MRRAGIAGALVAALVTALWLTGALDSDPRADDVAQSHPDARSHLRTLRVRGEPDPEVEAKCWAGLDRVDAVMTLADFRAWAAPLIAAGDPLVLEYLVDRLGELIGDDEGRAREVLGWVRGAGDELWVVLQGLQRAPAIHHPAIGTALARIGLDPTLDPERRTAVLAALDTQRKLAPEILDGLTGVAMKDEDSEAGWVAARTVGRVMAVDLGRGGDASPYLDRLLTIGARSPDAQVRSVALEMPMHVDAQVDAPTALRLSSIISGDPDPDVRKTAIHDLSLATDRDQTLQIYEDAFRAETDVCVRWALFRFTARAAGARALPVMARMAQLDPRFAEDDLVFERIYASGVVDFERVWQSLPDDDPHDCLASEGEEGAEDR